MSLEIDSGRIALGVAESTPVRAWLGPDTRLQAFLTRVPVQGVQAAASLSSPWRLFFADVTLTDGTRWRMRTDFVGTALRTVNLAAPATQCLAWLRGIFGGDARSWELPWGRVAFERTEPANPGEAVEESVLVHYRPTLASARQLFDDARALEGLVAATLSECVAAIAAAAGVGSGPDEVAAARELAATCERVLAAHDASTAAARAAELAESLRSSRTPIG